MKNQMMNSTSETFKHLKLVEEERFKNLIDRLSHNDQIFERLQERSSPDLTTSEKRQMLRDLLECSEALFMNRYHLYLEANDLRLFNLDDYEKDFYTKRIVKHKSSNCAKTGDLEKSENIAKRNQRYAELQRLKKETDYFCDAKMREREPFLFDRMVGKFQPEEQQLYLRPTIVNHSLSGVLMQFEDSQAICDRRNAQMNEWNDFLKLKKVKNEGNLELHPKLGNLAQHASRRFCDQLELSDTERDTENGILNDTSTFDNDNVVVNGHNVSANSSAKNGLWNVVNEHDFLNDELSGDDRSKEELKVDFIDHMEQRFLRGDDAEFYDYSSIDKMCTKEYERIRNQDLEDAYFDND